MSGRWFLIFTLLVAGSSEAAAPGALEAANRFWTAYSRGDADAAADTWATTGFPRARFIYDTQARCLHVIDSSLRIAHDGDDFVTVAVDATTARWPAADVAPLRVEDEHFEMDLHFDHVAWRVSRWTRREERLAEEIVQLPAPERHALLERNRELRTPRLVSALGRLAVRLVNQEKMDEAVALLAFARELAEETQDDRARSEVLGSDSVRLRRKEPQEPAASIENAEKAEGLAVRSQDLDAIAIARAFLARAVEIHDPPRAEALLLSILEVSSSLEDPTPVARAASQLSWMSGDRLEHGRSLRFSLTAAHYAELSGDASARLNAALNLAGDYGLTDLGAKQNERVLEIARSIGSVRIIGHVVPRLIEYYWSSETTRARGDAMYAEAFGATDCDEPAARVLRVLLYRIHARRAVSDGNRSTALKDFAAAYELSFRTDAYDHRIVADLLLLQAGLLVDGDPRQALTVLDEARALVADFPQWHSEANSAGTAARAHLLLGRHDLAEIELRRAIDVREQQRTNMVSDPLTRQNFLEGQAALYRDLVSLLADAGRNEEALRVADQLSARTLRDSQASADVASAGRTAEIVAAERQIVQLNQTLLSTRLNAAELASVRERLKNARVQLDDLRMRTASSRLETPVLQERPPDLDAIPPRGAVIKFVVLEKRTIAFIARPGAAITATVIPVSRATLENQIAALRMRIEERDLGYELSALAMDRLLVAPLFAEIEGAERLFLIPDGPLWLLPFQALRDDRGRALVERFEIAYAPSLSWVVDRRSSSPKAQSILAVGNPEIGATTRSSVRSLYPGRELGTLPDAAREAREVAKLYPRTRIMIGSEAQESALKQVVSGYDVVHLATHAFVEQAQPMYSSIALAARDGGDEDGLLEVREIESLTVHAQLIVLSACSTASGRVVSGEGVVGLAWAFLARGVPRVVGSQWQADSESTAALMIRFHRHLVAGERPAAALRKAQRELMRDPRYQHPFYWGAFTVVGAS